MTQGDGDQQVWLSGIGTAAAPIDYAQAELARGVARLLDDERAGRVLGHLFGQTEVSRRQSVLPDFDGASAPRLYRETPPTTAARNAAYEEMAPALAAKAARRALLAAGRTAAEVTHLFTVSCTGFFAPGLDVKLIGSLGLEPTVSRYHLGFMGCYAALPALDLARQAVADSGGLALVVCCELCSLHFQPTMVRDNLLSASLFGDGAAAAVVGGDGGLAKLGNHGSVLLPDCEGAMSWRVGDTGFVMGLAKEVPAILASELPALREQFNCAELANAPAVRWAVHPGGAAILDACEVGLALAPEALSASREVLRAHGNMSSATILFVLQQLLQTSAEGPICALAFGPGLTANWLVLT